LLRPKSSRLAATPANSAIVIATLAASSTVIAKKVNLIPNRSLISAANPFPVTTPIRADIS